MTASAASDAVLPATAGTTRENPARETSAAHATPDPARRYANFGGGVPELSRHPDDGWIRANPMPMGVPARDALRGLVRVICPPAPAPQLPDLEDRIENETRIVIRYMPRPVGWVFRLVLRLLDQAPRALFISRRRLHKLDVEAGRAIFHRLVNSPVSLVREAAGLARSLILSVYFDQDEVHAALGYAPIPFMRGRIDLRQRLLAGEQPRPDDMIPVTPGLDP